MATATAMSIGTSNKVTVDYQSQEVSISITFELERCDTDLQALVAEKAAEVERAHSAVWRRIRELRTQQKAKETGSIDQPGAESNPAQRTEAATSTAQAQPETREGTKSRRARSAKRPGNGDEPVETREDVVITATDGGNGATEGAHDAVGFVDGNCADPTESGDGNGRGESHRLGPNDVSASLAQQRAILSLANRASMDDQSLTTLLREIVGKSAVEQLTRQEAARLLLEMQRRDKLAAYRAA